MKENVADTEVHNHQLHDQIQSLAESSASMAALPGNSDDATSQVFQNKMKELVENFNRHSARPIDDLAPARRLVRIEEPV